MSGLPALTPAPERAGDRSSSSDAMSFARGARDEDLDRPAGALLASIPWEGLAPDPDELSTQAFLAWL